MWWWSGAGTGSLAVHLESKPMGLWWSRSLVSQPFSLPVHHRCLARRRRGQQGVGGYFGLLTAAMSLLRSSSVFQKRPSRNSRLYMFSMGVRSKFLQHCIVRKEEV